jgi:hypothetical protein
MINKTHILSDDIQYIEDILSQFGAYHFDTSLCGVMEDRKLSASELARRCHVSHTIIDKWRQGFSGFGKSGRGYYPGYFDSWTVDKDNPWYIIVDNVGIHHHILR